MVTSRRSIRQVGRYTRLHRVAPCRQPVTILDARENVLYQVTDATNTPVSHDDAVNVLNVHDTGQTWNLPTRQIQDDLQTISMNGWRIVDVDGNVWEILSVTLVSAGHTWRCVSKLMRRNSDG